MKEIYFLRHGETVLPHRYVGKSDISLSENGKKQILTLLPFARSRVFSRIYSSPLQRCVQSAEILGMSSTAIFDHRLCEIDFGLWERRTFEEISTNFPDEVAKWSRNESDFCFPEGEKITDFHKRLEDFVQEIENIADGKLLLIAHGGVIRHLLCRFLNLSYANYLYFKIECGKISVLELYSEGGILTRLNGEMADV
ncbi:MAG: histidine phosphatase family protein [Desulfopila sp.]|jgi:alpha-ribazole phosphatase|nr:histidine phosphatase family protein [Desulfopila sp.]